MPMSANAQNLRLIFFLTDVGVRKGVLVMLY
jgi:hypothetical protein